MKEGGEVKEGSEAKEGGAVSGHFLPRKEGMKERKKRKERKEVK